MAEVTELPGIRRQEWVRTFLFFMRLDAPLAQLHIVTKIIMVLTSSLCLMRMISTDGADPVGSAFLLVVGFLLLWLSGVIKWLFRSYLVVIYPMLIGLFVTWMLFNPVTGTRVLFQHRIYSGTIHLGVSVAAALVIVIPLVYHRITKKLLWGIVIGVAAGIAVSRTPFNVTWIGASLPVFQPIDLIISDQTLLTATSKVLGYGAMVLMTLLLVLTTRDVEVIGALRKVPRMPYAVVIFIAIILRSLNIALIDFSTIRQAQVARGINVRPKSVIAKIRDMAFISVPLIANMMRRSMEISDALSARGYELGVEPTIHREVKPMRSLDWAFVVLFAALPILVLWGHVNLSTVVAGLGRGG